MHDILNRAEVFQGLSSDERGRLASIGRTRSLQPGDYLFILGDDATDFYVVGKGKLDLCFPVRLRGLVREISVESVGPGQALGWSALVKPYRFTLSARATEPSEVIGFARRDLLARFDSQPRTGYTFFTRIAEIAGIRLLKFEALWVRELQRVLEFETQRLAERPPAPSP